MNIDFTLEIYEKLLKTFKKNNYKFFSFEQYLKSKLLIHNSSHITHHASLILRHDVDRLPENALQTAMIEHELGIKGTYYFRIVPESYDQTIMEKIAKLGHEIGYHYEDVDLVVKRNAFSVMREELNGKHKNIHYASLITHHLIDTAYESFCKNLEMLRKNFDIKTICMHGSPRSKYDNKLIWTKYDYRDLGIIGEPYFDIDFTEFAYYTDTGRRWDGDAVSVRDKVGRIQRLENSDQKSVDSRQYAVNSKQYGVSSKEEERVTRDASRVTNRKWPRFRKTNEIIKAIEEGRFPQKAMITVHPQRWTNDPMLWAKELVWQNVKNIVKWGIVKIGSME